ncbi:aminotransferase class V-fold PLP-dependent enzyme [Ekhidna sp.]|uniref:pyridoxal phosphate-dependent decarboxylase family protein n=1 Tax=Ekhidna sp. TaxID=2608089 RepID=UPI0032ED3F89
MKENQLKDYLEQTWNMIRRNGFDNPKNVLKTNDPQEIKNLLAKDLPQNPSAYSTLLRNFEHEILPGLNYNTSPNFGAYITGSGNKIGAVAEFIKAFYNQNGLKWNNSPITSELEQLVIKWIAEFCLVPNHNKGVLTSGGSMSNFMSLHFALAKRFPNREMEGFYGASKFTIYCSDQTHSSIDRAMVFLGLGRNQLRKIQTNAQYQIGIAALEKAINDDLKISNVPLMIIGNAGTTNTGTIDPLNQLAKIAKKYDLWYHVDGAYGLPAIRLPEFYSRFEGVEHADSIIMNPHKWMYVPFEASCVLLKEIPEAIHFSPDYLFTENPGERWESSNHTIELSKEFRALKVWFTLKYHGATQLTNFIKHDIDMIQYLADRLAPDFHIDPNHDLSILCFRFNDSSMEDAENERINIHAIRTIESKGKIFITGTKLQGKTHLRVYYGNPERTTKDVDYMINVIKETFQHLVSA